MTPLDAVRREVCIELDALERRLGSKSVPTVITIRIKMDSKTCMPRVVDVTEERERRILGSAIS